MADAGGGSAWQASESTSSLPPAPPSLTYCHVVHAGCSTWQALGTEFTAAQPDLVTLGCAGGHAVVFRRPEVDVQQFPLLAEIVERSPEGEAVWVPLHFLQISAPCAMRLVAFAHSCHLHGPPPPVPCPLPLPPAASLRQVFAVLRRCPRGQ